MEDGLKFRLWVLGTAFAMFTFLSTTNKAILQNNIFLSLQLVLAIPLATSSYFSAAKAKYSPMHKMWEHYSFYFFITGYCFLINSIGIILSIIIGKHIASVYFALNAINPVVYSFFDICEARYKLRKRIAKDAYFIAILILGGILPAIIF